MTVYHTYIEFLIDYLVFNATQSVILTEQSSITAKINKYRGKYNNNYDRYANDFVSESLYFEFANIYSIIELLYQKFFFFISLFGIVCRAGVNFYCII